MPPRQGAYDEMLAADGSVRPHWRAFVDGFAGLGTDGRAAAGESTRRLLRESGIAFNVYADPDDRAHAWRLDLVPVLLPDAEWDRLAAGIVQRARLIDAVLADLHGAQTLLHDGSLPASLLLGNPAFVRASVDRDAPERRFLSTYACDIARTASGDWVVLGDQTDTAIGNGYVLASRVALSHGLAELFRDCHTQRLARYFLGLQESFQALCRRDDGRIVILSPGPESPSYFSHSYLARYLGYTVVQSGDLTVRDNHLYLKTLDGLQRVYLVVCKQPGHRMDPLSLPGSGLAGIPGLVEAARSGNVVMVNRLGSGVVQNHALAPFTPSRCSAASWARTPCSRTCARCGSAIRRHAPRRWRSRSAGRSWRRPSATIRASRPSMLTGPLERGRAHGARGPAGHGSASLGRGRAGPPRHDTRLRRRPAGAGALRAARLRRGRAGRLPRPARRARPPRGRARAPPCCPTASAARTSGSPQPPRELTAGQHPALDHAGGASAADRPRPAQPDHRQSVLARPLRRARRRHHAPAAQRAGAVPRGRAPRQQSRGAAAAAAPVPAQGPGQAQDPRGAGLGRRRGAGRHPDARAALLRRCATASTSCTAPPRWCATRSATTPGGC